MTFSAFELVEARGLFVHPKRFSLIVTRVLEQAQVWAMIAHKENKDSLR